MGTDGLTDQKRKLIASIHKMGCENKRLRAIVAKLPKTADGVPVVPGMMVYSDHGEWEVAGFRVDEEGKLAEIMSGGFGFDRLCTGWYSTREAAEAAGGGVMDLDERKETLENIADIGLRRKLLLTGLLSWAC